MEKRNFCQARSENGSLDLLIIMIVLRFIIGIWFLSCNRHLQCPVGLCQGLPPWAERQGEPKLGREGTNCRVMVINIFMYLCKLLLKVVKQIDGVWCVNGSSFSRSKASFCSESEFRKLITLGEYTHCL
jgi:hypothetical protein